MFKRSGSSTRPVKAAANVDMLSVGPDDSNKDKQSGELQADTRSMREYAEEM